MFLEIFSIRDILLEMSKYLIHYDLRNLFFAFPQINLTKKIYLDRWINFRFNINYFSGVNKTFSSLLREHNTEFGQSIFLEQNKFILGNNEIILSCKFRQDVFEFICKKKIEISYLDICRYKYAPVYYPSFWIQKEYFIEFTNRDRLLIIMNKYFSDRIYLTSGDVFFAHKLIDSDVLAKIIRRMLDSGNKDLICQIGNCSGLLNSHSEIIKEINNYQTRIIKKYLSNKDIKLIKQNSKTQ